MKLAVLARKVRGFRLLDLAALFVVLAMALSVYAFKTSAGAQREDIADVESQIHDETRQVRLLQAEVDRLESPNLLESKARAAGQAPVEARQEVTPDELAGLAAGPPAANAAAAAAAPPPAAEPPR
jgi:hypothetical protein